MNVLIERAFRRFFAVGLLAMVWPVSGLAGNGMTVIESQHGVAETEERLIEAVEGNGLTVMAQVDHQANAKTVDMEMPATRLVIFGNPAAGTQLMKCAPTVAIDLPMKMLIWEDGDTVKVAYNTAGYLVERHGIGDCAAPVQGKIRQALHRFARVAAGAE